MNVLKRIPGILAAIICLSVPAYAEHHIEPQLVVLTAEDPQIATIQQSGTVAMMSVDLVANTRYSIEARAAEEGADPQIFLNSPDGDSINYNDDITAGEDYNSRITFIPRDTGRYTLIVRFVSTETGDIGVAMINSGPIEIKRVQLGEQVRGSIQVAGASEVFDVALEANKLYRIMTNALHGNDTILQVSAPNGDSLGAIDDQPGTSNAGLYLAPETSGDFRFEVSNLSSGLGEFIFEASEVTDILDIGQSGGVQNATPFTRPLVYKLEAGKEYTVEVKGSSTSGDDSYIDDPVAYLIPADPNGETLEFDDTADSYDPLESFTAPATGFYVLYVKDVQGSNKKFEATILLGDVNSNSEEM